MSRQLERLVAEKIRWGKERRKLEAENERYIEALTSIVQWAEAYPKHIFPEPDDAYLAKAHEVLTANGMALDRLSASAMRHVVTGVGDIARAALNSEGGL